MKFKHTWLSIYPRPQCRMYDNEGEFTGGGAFQTMMEWAGIKDIMDRINNPDVNMVCKRMHQIFWRTCNGYCCMCSHQQMKAGGWFVALFDCLQIRCSTISRKSMFLSIPGNSLFLKLIFFSILGKSLFS